MALSPPSRLAQAEPPAPSFGAAEAGLELDAESPAARPREPQDGVAPREDAPSTVASTEVQAGESAAREVPPPAEAETAPAAPPLPDTAVEELQPPSPTSHAARSRSRPRRSRRPRAASVWGDTWITGAISVGRRSFGFGVEGTRFVVRHIGLGLSLHNTIAFPPGQPAINLFTATPVVTFLGLPHRRVTPILRGGFGGAFFNGGGGAYGRWVGGVGVAFAAGEHLRLDLGVEVEGLVPDDKYEERFRCGGLDQLCSFALVPVAGVGWRT